MTPSGSNKKVANGLVAVSCAAVMAVYTAGYVRTRSAANQFDVQAAERRPAVQVDQETLPATAELRPADPSSVMKTSPEPARAVPAESSAVAPAEPAPVTAPIEPAVPSAEPSPVVPPAPVAPVPVAPVKEQSAVAAPAAPPAPKWKDGTFTGWGTSRHGDIEAEVVIEDGRIVSASFAQCLTRYPCSVIDMLPAQVVQRQSADVDFVSRATESADAFYFGLVEALSKAK